MINIKNDLASWLVNWLTNAVHNTESEDSPEFNKWAKSFEEDEANTLVSMEFGNDWGYDTRSEITEDDLKGIEKDIQDITDAQIKEIDKIAEKKNKEIMEI